MCTLRFSYQDLKREKKKRSVHFDVRRKLNSKEKKTKPNKKRTRFQSETVCVYIWAQGNLQIQITLHEISALNFTVDQIKRHNFACSVCARVFFSFIKTADRQWQPSIQVRKRFYYFNSINVAYYNSHLFRSMREVFYDFFVTLIFSVLENFEYFFSRRVFLFVFSLQNILLSIYFAVTLHFFTVILCFRFHLDRKKRSFESMSFC